MNYAFKGVSPQFLKELGFEAKAFVHVQPNKLMPTITCSYIRDYITFVYGQGRWSLYLYDNPEPVDRDKILFIMKYLKREKSLKT